MSKISVGHYEQDGGTIYLPLGYVPDYAMLCDFHTSTNIIFYHWWREMENEEAAEAQEGISVTEGVTARLADDAGLAEYDTGTEGPTVSEWTSAVSTAATARTSTARGTLVKATTSGVGPSGAVMDRSAIFECVTAGTSSGTEPTWPEAIGEQVLDSDVCFERVDADEALKRTGYQGLEVQDNIQTDGQEMYYLCLQSDDSMDWGDVSAWPSGIYNG